MKNKTLIIVLIILLSAIAIGITVFMIRALSGNLKESFNLKLPHKVSNTLIVNEIYDNIFDEINIRTNASDISIKNSTNDKIKVVIYGDKKRTSVEASNNLDISSKPKKCIGICFDTKLSKIEVYVPNNYNKTINIKNNYGDIEIADLSNANINIDEDAGDISIDKASKVKIKNDYGDIEIKNVTNYLDIDEDAGDVKIESISLKKNSSIKNDYGDIIIGITNEIYIDAKTDLGDVKIKNNYHKSDVILKIDNDCGDITIRN